MILPIIAYGHSVLREECDEIEENKDMSSLIASMFETMYNSKGVGLACPQIGKSLRMFIVDASPFADEEPENKKQEKQLAELKKF